jgi:hypothetical protein
MTKTNNKKEKYGNKYQDHLIEQYKIYLSGIEKNSDRRNSANKYFLSINTALITILGLTFQFGSYDGRVFVRIMVALAGIILSIIFFFLIRAYKQLNTGKFEIIHKIEEDLPCSPYKDEWVVLEEGKNWKTYFPFSHVELLIPWVFGFGYILILIYVIKYLI